MCDHPVRAVPTHCRGAGVDALSGGDRSGGLNSVGAELLAAGVPAGRKILVVSNPDVAGPYGDRCLHSLRSSGFQVDLLVIEAGEERKTPATVARIHDAAFDMKLERSSLMLALGGGVVGDMTGLLRPHGCAESRCGAGADHAVSPWWTPRSAERPG